MTIEESIALDTYTRVFKKIKDLRISFLSFHLNKLEKRTLFPVVSSCACLKFPAVSAEDLGAQVGGHEVEFYHTSLFT